MPVDDAAATLIAQFRSAGTPPMHKMTLGDLRAMGAGLVDLIGPGPAMERVEDVMIPGAEAGGRALRILHPGPSPRGLLVFYFGGGWTMGSIDEVDALGRTIAQRTGCVVVLPSYRLAPEHRFPAAVDDAWAALTWSASHAVEFIGRPGPLIVMGDSAGANLAAVMALIARDAGSPVIDLQVLSCPVTDCDFETDSYLDPANDLLLPRDTMLWFWDNYAPDTSDRRSPRASPLLAADLSGVAPALVITAEYDVLRDDGESYAARLAEAGVPTNLHRFDGQIHSFTTLVNVLPGSSAALDLVQAEVDRTVAPAA